MRGLFPQGAELTELLDLDRSVANELDLDELFASALTNPVDDFFARPRKNVRNQLVELGFMVAARSLGQDCARSVIDRACEVLEIFHAGSLVVDDIEDGSLYRRGSKSLHQLYGMPLALNAGNWLYFVPFKMIEDMDLDADRKSALARECQSTLLRAHYGQALDLGVDIENLDQSKVYDVALAAMELKAGVLTGLALSMGAIALGASPNLIAKLNRYGRKIGVALQMFDDLGNLSSSHNVEKRCEDLKLKRVGYVFGFASRVLTPAQFAELLSLTRRLPQSCESLLALLDASNVGGLAQREAVLKLSRVIEVMSDDLKLNELESEQMAWLRACLVESYA